jgi:hypothetical protein
MIRLEVHFTRLHVEHRKSSNTILEYGEILKSVLLKVINFVNNKRHEELQIVQNSHIQKC